MLLLAACYADLGFECVCPYLLVWEQSVCGVCMCGNGEVCVPVLCVLKIIEVLLKLCATTADV